MRKLIVVITVVAAPLATALPATAATTATSAIATAVRAASGSDAAPVAMAPSAVDEMLCPPAEPPPAEARDAAAPGTSADTRSGGADAVAPTGLHAGAEGLLARTITALSAVDAATTLEALARAPPHAA